jgi:sphingolipid delta-4 desaturase
MVLAQPDLLKTYLNTLAAIAANLPHLLPSAVSFQRYHMKHHAFQGVYDLDADLPSHWEARLIGNSAIGKALWLLLFPIFQVTRPPRLKEIRMFDRWIVLNFAVQIAFDVAVYEFFGPKAFCIWRRLLRWVASVGVRWIRALPDRASARDGATTARKGCVQRWVPQ